MVIHRSSVLPSLSASVSSFLIFGFHQFGLNASASDGNAAEPPPRLIALLVRFAISDGSTPARYSGMRQNTWPAFSPAPYWARDHRRSPVSSHMVFRADRTVFFESRVASSDRCSSFR